MNQTIQYVVDILLYVKKQLNQILTKLSSSVVEQKLPRRPMKESKMMDKY